MSLKDPSLKCTDILKMLLRLVLVALLCLCEAVIRDYEIAECRRDLRPRHVLTGVERANSDCLITCFILDRTKEEGSSGRNFHFERRLTGRKCRDGFHVCRNGGCYFVQTDLVTVTTNKPSSTKSTTYVTKPSTTRLTSTVRTTSTVRPISTVKSTSTVRLTSTVRSTTSTTTVPTTTTTLRTTPRAETLSTIVKHKTRKIISTTTELPHVNVTSQNVTTPKTVSVITHAPSIYPNDTHPQWVPMYKGHLPLGLNDNIYYRVVNNKINIRNGTGTMETMKHLHTLLERFKLGHISSTGEIVVGNSFDNYVTEQPTTTTTIKPKKECKVYCNPWLFPLEFMMRFTDGTVPKEMWDRYVVGGNGTEVK